VSERLLVDYARELGIPMRAVHLGAHVGFTHDAAAVATLRGSDVWRCAVNAYRATRANSTEAEAARFDGYEVVIPIGTPGP
jgi:hypothetical protein